MKNSYKFIKVLYIASFIFIMPFFSSDVPAGFQQPAESRKEYIIGGDENFPPYEFVLEVNGQKVYRGFNVDIMKAIALQTGIEIEFKPMVWSEALKALDEGRIDAIQGMKYSEERDEKYDFSDSFITNSQAVFVLKSSPAVNMNDLAGKRIAVQEGDIAYQKLKDSSLYQLVKVPDQATAFELLFSEKVDAVIGNKLVGQYILQQNRKIGMVKLVDQEIDPQKYAIAVKKGNDELLQILNRGLYEIKKNGTYDKIYEKWFGQPLDYPLQYYKKRILMMFYGIGALYLALALMLYVNFLLQREVKRRIATEKQLIERIAQKDKMEAIGNLAAGIAHEIRNPLTSIKTFVELLPQKYDNPLFREKISYFVPREIERLNSLLNTLLDYARPRKSLQQTENLLDLVRNTLVLFGTMFEKNKIRIAVEIDPDLKVFVDRQQIQQVFINVIMNAVEATEGVSEPKILIAAEQKAKEVIIVFQDNGMGIENDNLRKIFDPFFTTKPTGTGLGLAVSYQILKENMGRIWVESKPGEGTKVFISLPIGKEV